MKFDPEIHHRRSIRLKGYDYSQPGAYFVTMVTQGRASLFGTIENGEMHLNDAGEMISGWWNELPNKFPQITLGVFVVMPNHFHGIIMIEAYIPVGGDLRVSPGSSENKKGGHAGPEDIKGGHAGPPQPLSQMIQWFKTMTTNEYIRGVKTLGWPRFDRKLWQRDYYEHIIRNDGEAKRIHLYIESNPIHWAEDEESR